MLFIFVFLLSLSLPFLLSSPLSFVSLSCPGLACLFWSCVVSSYRGSFFDFVVVVVVVERHAMKMQMCFVISQKMCTPSVTSAFRTSSIWVFTKQGQNKIRQDREGQD
jgi:hypothetical protein